jgi:hypothetical protein
VIVMRLLPLTLSMHASSFNSEAAPSRVWGGSDHGSCRFCGLKAAGWQEPFHLNGDHADDAKDNIVSACALCHLAQHLERETIDDAAVLIWLPEMTQGALNALARGIHARLVAHGQPAHLCQRPSSRDVDVLAAFSASMALRSRSDQAAARLGTASPRQLGQALSRLKPEVYARRRALLAGLRLLPLGRYFRGGEDIYPGLIAQLQAPRGGAAMSGMVDTMEGSSC